jgi:hypothetical protein
MPGSENAMEIQTILFMELEIQITLLTELGPEGARNRRVKSVCFCFRMYI